MTLDHSKWNVSARGGLDWGAGRTAADDFNIVMLEDHSSYSDMIKSQCITPFFPRAKLQMFRNGYETFRFLKKAMDEEFPIDLVITDHNHPGMDGILLVMNIRAYEEKIRTARKIPIFMLTMMGPELKLIGEDYPYFRIDKYLSKFSSTDEIIDTLEELLFRRKKWLLECFVAGFQYYEGNRVLPQLQRGTRIRLQRENNNPHDSRAVAIYVKDHKIGYIPAGNNRIVTDILDAGRNPVFAEITEVNVEAADWIKVKVGMNI